MGYSDEKIIEGLRQKKRSCIHFVYTDYFPLILDLIEKNSGTYQDAEDVFQDALVVLYQRCRDRELGIKCALRTYFYSICRNIWLQRLERNSKIIYLPGLVVHDHEARYDAEYGSSREEELARERLFYKHFSQLPEDCRKVLRMYMDKVPLKKIAEAVGFRDENYAKVRKYLCKKLLIKRIIKDPDYINYHHHE